MQDIRIMDATQRKALSTIVGQVSSRSGDKSVRVVLDYLTKHPKYGKMLKRRTVAHVHDEANLANAGDFVEIVKCRRMSKTKSWRLIKVVESAEK